MSGGSSAVILSGCLVEVDVEVCGDARFFRLAKGEVEIDSEGTVSSGSRAAGAVKLTGSVSLPAKSEGFVLKCWKSRIAGVLRPPLEERFRLLHCSRNTSDGRLHHSGNVRQASSSSPALVLVPAISKVHQTRYKQKIVKTTMF